MLQRINFTDQFYAPPVVMVTAKRVNNDSHLSGCNAITAWVEIKTQTCRPHTLLQFGRRVFLNTINNYRYSILKRIANYLNKKFKEKKMKIRQLEN